VWQREDSQLSRSGDWFSAKFMRSIRSMMKNNTKLVLFLVLQVYLVGRRIVNFAWLQKAKTTNSTFCLLENRIRRLGKSILNLQFKAVRKSWNNSSEKLISHELKCKLTYLFVLYILFIIFFLFFWSDIFSEYKNYTNIYFVKLLSIISHENGTFILFICA
jgi:hypothetical protein